MSRSKCFIPFVSLPLVVPSGTTSSSSGLRANFLDPAETKFTFPTDVTTFYTTLIGGGGLGPIPEEANGAGSGGGGGCLIDANITLPTGTHSITYSVGTGASGSSVATASTMEVGDTKLIAGAGSNGQLASSLPSTGVGGLGGTDTSTYGSEVLSHQSFPGTSGTDSQVGFIGTLTPINIFYQSGNGGSNGGNGVFFIDSSITMPQSTDAPYPGGGGAGGVRVASLSSGGKDGADGSIVVLYTSSL